MSSWRDPEIAGVRALLAAHQPPPGAPPPTDQQRRAAMDAEGDRSPLPPGCFHEPVWARAVHCERIEPAGAAHDRWILYLHGGGYRTGSARSNRPVAARLAAAAGVQALAADYRLAPENRFPAAVEDAVAVYRWMLDRGAEPERIVIAGASAGGGLAIAAALSLKAQGMPQPAGLFVISPWADLTNSSRTHRVKAADDPMINRAYLEQAAAAYLGPHDRRDPLASPVFGELEGLAPLFIQVGSEETLLGDSLMLAERAGQARVEVRLEVWPEMIHVWHKYSDQLDAGRRAIEAAGAWVRGKVG